MKTPLGEIEITHAPNGQIKSISWAKKPSTSFSKEVKDFFAQKNQSFKLSDFSIEGFTPFQLAVWRELLKVPFGETRTYGWLAKKAGYPKGARAVGQALKKNPIPILIPCHRIVGEKELGGYMGAHARGVSIKRKLLEFEGSLKKTPR